MILRASASGCGLGACADDEHTRPPFPHLATDDVVTRMNQGSASAIVPPLPDRPHEFRLSLNSLSDCPQASDIVPSAAFSMEILVAVAMSRGRYVKMVSLLHQSLLRPVGLK